MFSPECSSYAKLGQAACFMTPQSSSAFPHRPLVISTHLLGRDRAHGWSRNRDLSLLNEDVVKEKEEVAGGISHIPLPLDAKDPMGSLCHTPLVILKSQFCGFNTFKCSPTTSDHFPYSLLQ